MGMLFDVYGNPIDIDTIREFRLQRFDYVFRPAFREVDGGFWKRRAYEFIRMEPYGEILAVNGKKSALAEFKPTKIGDAIIQDVGAFVGSITDGIAQAFNLKTVKDPVYRIKRSSSEPFDQHLYEVPARVYDRNGRARDVQRNDDTHKLIGDSVEPVVETVPALTIVTDKERFVFFGLEPMGLPSPEQEYRRLLELRESEQRAAEERRRLKPAASRPALPHVDLRGLGQFIPQVKISIPAFNRKQQPEVLPNADNDEHQS